MKRRGPAPAVLIALCALPFWSAPAAAAPRAATEPRLILPGDRTVRPGQVIELRWAPADSVVELEILLSRDGGRHYSLCISPRLDPRRCSYVWRVPDLACPRLSLRIRFNRGGGEVEGTPSEPLRVAESRRDSPEPLGVPPAADAARDAPRPGGRGEAPASGSACGPLEPPAGPALSRSPFSTRDPLRPAHVPPSPAASAPLTAPAKRGPRHVPMRA